MVPAAVPFATKSDPYLRERLSEIAAPTARDTVALLGEVVLAKFTNGTPRLQPRAPMSKQSESDVVGHLVPPSYATRNKADGMNSHYGSITKTLGERVSAALTKRLFPKTNLTRKQLQDALKISVGTMDNLLTGHHDPSGRVLDKLVAFFKDSFINEIWGGHNIHCIDTRAAEKAVLVAQMVAAQAELRRLG